MATTTETQLDDLTHELAYERVKHSYLFNVLDNAAVDAKADELAARLLATMDEWLAGEGGATAQRSERP